MSITLKRSLLCLLTLLTVLFSLTACTQGTTPPLDSSTVAGITTAQPSGSGDQTPAPDYLSMPFTEEVGSISVFGTPISQYSIVIPQDCDIYTQSAAQNFADYLSYNANIKLSIVTDDTAATQYEFLFGATNRSASKFAKLTPHAADEYVMLREGNSIAFYGDGYMVGAGAGRFITHLAAGAWRGYDIDITEIPNSGKAQKFTYEAPNNAILLIGDGMGRGAVDMTLAGGMDGFCADDMSARGEIVTKSQSVINGQATATDSAASGTALATGFKTLNGFVGLNPDRVLLQNVREIAHLAGAKTAILTTDEITGATPSAFLAHVASRNDENALQKNVTELLFNKKVDYAESYKDSDEFVGAAMAALQNISKHGSQFFTMMEEGYIDKHAHNNNTPGVTHAVERLNTVVAYCMEFMFFHPDTLLIVTADHETGGVFYRESTDSYHYMSRDHTNVDVPIYAMGVGSEYFNGTVHDNTRVPVQIAKIFSKLPFGDSTYN